MSESSLQPASPNIPEIVQRYLAGESCQALATELNVNRMTIYRWMMDGKADAQYDELVTNALINRIAIADQNLDTALDQCSIARAREVARFARMDFERRRPKLYGPKQEMNTDLNVNITINRSLVIPPVVVNEVHNLSTSASAQEVSDKS